MRSVGWAQRNPSDQRLSRGGNLSAEFPAGRQYLFTLNLADRQGTLLTHHIDRGTE